MICSVKRPAMFSRVKLPARSVKAAPTMPRVGRNRNITAKMMKGTTARKSQGMRRGGFVVAVIVIRGRGPTPSNLPIKREVPLHSWEGAGHGTMVPKT
jgi:hypothetical protein